MQRVRIRRDPIAPVEVGHQASYLGMTAKIAVRLGRKLQWDPQAERFVGDDRTNCLLSTPMRSPGHLEARAGDTPKFCGASMSMAIMFLLFRIWSALSFDGAELLFCRRAWIVYVI